MHDYVQGDQEGTTEEASTGEQRHEVPIHGEIHTISGGFSRGGCTASQRKSTSAKYENNDPLFSAALRLNAFVKNAMAFL